MESKKVIRFSIDKPFDYQPITDKERKRVKKKVIHELFEVANRFDGGCKVELVIIARGNA